MVPGILLGALVADAWLNTQAQLPPPWVWPVLALLALPLWPLRHRRWSRHLTVTLLAASLVGGYTQWRALARLQQRLPAAAEARALTVTGTVRDLPQRSPGRIHLRFAVDSGWPNPSSGQPHILLTQLSNTGPGVLPLRGGQRWRLLVKLKRPAGPLSPGGQDREAWLFENNIAAVGSIVHGQYLGDANDPGAQLSRVRENISERMRAMLGQRPAAGMLIAVTNGDQSGISRQQWQLFARTGIIHLVSISGLHITLVAGLCAGLAGMLWRRLPRLPLWLPTPWLVAGMGACTALGYALLAGFSVPTQRTLFVLLVVAVNVFWRKLPLLHSLAWAVIAVIMFDPFSILAPGFWLSFGAVAAIAVTAHGELGQPTRLAEWLRAQWAVSIGLAPLLLLLFQQFPATAPLANAIAIPIIGAIATPMALAGAALHAGWLVQLAATIVEQLLPLLQWLSDLPAWEQAAPPTSVAALALLGALYAIAPRGLPGRWLGLVALLPMLSWHSPPLRAGEWQASVLDVGQGLAVVIRTGQHTLLYDTGPGWQGGDAGETLVLPSLRGLGVRHIDAMVLSHNHLDHTGGAQSIIDAMPVDELIASLPPQQPLWRGQELKLRCAAGQHWTWDEVQFAVLNPPPGSLPKEVNATSCMVRVSSRYGSLLLPGDIGGHTERELVNAGSALRSDVLIAPHHGSKTSSTAAFIEAVAPKLVIFSAGYGNHFRHPQAEALARYQGIAQYRTDYDGGITIRVGSNAYVSSERQLRGRYWQLPAPAAHTSTVAPPTAGEDGPHEEPGDP